MHKRIKRLSDKLRHPGWPGWVFAAGLLADVVSTGLLFSTFGSEDEVHPVIHLVGGLTGPWMAAAVGKLGQLAGLVVLALFLERRWLRIAMAVTGILYLLAAAANLIQCAMA